MVARSNIVTDAQLRFFLIANRVIQWLSSVVVLGITSYLINVGPRGRSILYEEIIAVLSVAFFIPGFISVFLSNPIKEFVIFIDLVFSYLWIVAFAFAANDYNTGNCHANAPPGIPCSKKWANEAFIFLAFIFTFFAVLLESISLWSYRRGQGNNRSSETAPLRGNERRAASPVRENGGPTYPSSHPLHHHHDVEKLQGEGQPSRPTHFTEHTSAGATGGASTAPSQPLYAAPAQPGYAAPAQPGYAVPAPAPAQTGYAAPMQPA